MKKLSERVECFRNLQCSILVSIHYILLYFATPRKVSIFPDF